MLKDWDALFDEARTKPYAKSLRSFLNEEYGNHVVYPPREKMFQAFRLTSPSSLKVVIIGQDPYHNPGQAMGLSFSVPQGITPPPSLINIYKEIESDVGYRMNHANGDLTPWAEQGVLLLNAYLTVREGEPLTHRRPEYESFMAETMRFLDCIDRPIVFMLWGNFAKKYAKDVHNRKHLVLSASHPSPLALSHGGWFGMHLFSQCNDFLAKNGVSPIDWTIS